MRTCVVVSYFLDVAAFSWMAAGTSCPLTHDLVAFAKTDRPCHHLADGQPAELFAPTIEECVSPNRRFREGAFC
jgi:hypothetical protein